MRIMMVAALGLVFLGAQAWAIDRSRAVTEEFQHLYPCPATGKTKGACPGWIKDHVIPLCAGGADAVDNMQWQTKANAGVKDRQEWAECRALRTQWGGR